MKPKAAGDLVAEVSYFESNEVRFPKRNSSYVEQRLCLSSIYYPFFEGYYIMVYLCTCLMRILTLKEEVLNDEREKMTMMLLKLKFRAAA